MKKYFLQLLLFFCFSANAQTTDSSWAQKPTVSVEAFADVYYVFDFNQPTQGFRMPFLYNHNRHQEVNLNLGYVKWNIAHQKYRANLGLQAGTYVQDNYAAEPVLLRPLFEANVGVALDKKDRFWFDMGVFPSHIGFESAVSPDNWTMTRSLLAENSPYFLAGAKWTYSPSQKWQFMLAALNGWQRIQRLPNHRIPALGTQIMYKPKEGITLNWSTFIGSDDPEIPAKKRYFSNQYGLFSLTPKSRLIAGIDVGIQQKRALKQSDYSVWFSPVVIAQYDLSKNMKMAGRIEYYQDRDGVLISSENNGGFRTWGYSLNLDYAPAAPLLARVEARYLPLYQGNSSFFVSTSLSIKFGQIFHE
ncbi:MAG: porin [Spirosomataceae bacterium]